MSRRRKLGDSIVFTLGIAACVASIVRFYFTVLKSTSADLTYHSSMMQLTAVAEGVCGTLVLCVPAMPKAAADQLTRWLRRPPRKDDPDGEGKDKDDSLSWHLGSSLDSRPLPNINADGLGLGNTVNGPQHEVGGCELGPKTADETYGCLRDGHG
ncbi:60S ribosomal protein L36 [Metarhizium brunneum]